jgi:hypothetical protein
VIKLATNVFFPGFDGGRSQIDAYEHLLDKAGFDGTFAPYAPYGRAPYLSPRGVVEKATNCLIELIQQADLHKEADRLSLNLHGLSMGGQTAVRVYERLARLGYGSRVEKVVAIDPPWDDFSIVPAVKSKAIQVFGYLPPVTYRHWKLAAQGASIAKMMKGFEPVGIDLMRVHIISCTNNVDVIASDRANSAWIAGTPSGINFHWLPPGYQHSHLSPDVPSDATDEWRVKHDSTQNALLGELTEILKRLQPKLVIRYGRLHYGVARFNWSLDFISEHDIIY